MGSDHRDRTKTRHSASVLRGSCDERDSMQRGVCREGGSADGESDMCRWTEGQGLLCGRQWKWFDAKPTRPFEGRSADRESNMCRWTEGQGLLCGRQWKWFD